MQRVTVLPVKSDSDFMFVYKVIRDLWSIDHLCINPILWIGLIHKWSIDWHQLKWSVRILVLLSNCKQRKSHCHSWLSRQYLQTHLILSSLTRPPLFHVYPGLYCRISTFDIFFELFFSLCLCLAELTGILEDGSFIASDLKFKIYCCFQMKCMPQPNPPNPILPTHTLTFRWYSWSLLIFFFFVKSWLIFKKNSRGQKCIKISQGLKSGNIILILKRQSQQKSSAFLVCWNVLEASMANSVDPDQTAPIGEVWSGSTLFASILNSSVMLGNYLQQRTSAHDIFRCIFFLAL